jgi:hypothetical protein
LHCCLFFAFFLCFAIVKSTGTGLSTGKAKENQGVAAQKENHRKSTGKKVLLQLEGDSKAKVKDKNRK